MCTRQRSLASLHRWKLPLIAGLIIATFCLGSVSANPMTSGQWWDEREEGWFWYEDPPAEKQAKKPEPKPGPESAVTVLAPDTTETETEEVGPEPLSVLWLKENLPEYRQRALDNPTDENVEAYMLLQRVSIDKAQQFADKVSQVVNGDPVLDEYAQYPSGTMYANAMLGEANSATDDVLFKLAKSAGLYFFYESTCQYCHLQARVLKTLERTVEFEIIPVSLDGKPLPGEHYTDFRPDRGQAKALGIDKTPALVLVRPPNGMEVVAHGLATVKELKSRMIGVAAKRGWIDRRDLDRTRPTGPRPANLANTELTRDEAKNVEQLLEKFKGGI